MTENDFPLWMKVSGWVYVAFMTFLVVAQFYWAKRHYDHAQRRNKSKFSAIVFLIAGICLGAILLPSAFKMAQSLLRGQ